MVCRITVLPLVLAAGYSIGWVAGGRVVLFPRFYNTAAVCKGTSQSSVYDCVGTADTSAHAQRTGRAVLLACSTLNAGIEGHNHHLAAAAGENCAGADIEAGPAAGTRSAHSATHGSTLSLF